MFRKRSVLLQSEDGSYLNQYLFTISMAFCQMAAGQHYGWTMPYLNRILSGEFELSLDEDEASYLAMVSYAGDVIGAIAASALFDKIGRKKAVLSIAIPQILGYVMTYYSVESKSLLFCARVSGGIGEGAILAIGPTYLSEIAVPELRGALNALICIAFPVGAGSINILGSYFDIPTTALISLLIPTIFVCSFFLMPESPYYLLMKDRTDEAEESLKLLRRSYNVKDELNMLTKDVARQMSETGTYKDLFTIPANRFAFILAAILRGFQQFTGYTAVTIYLQVLLKEATNFSPTWGSTILLIIQILMNFVSYLSVERLGRKVLLMISSTTSFTVLFFLSTFFLLRDHTDVDTSSLSWLPLLLLVFYVMGFMSGYGTVVGMFTSEIFSTSIKSKALGLTGILFAAEMMFSIKLYQYLADNVGMATCFFVFTMFSLFSIIFIFFYIPETKGKTLEEIQQDLIKKKIKNANDV